MNTTKNRVLGAGFAAVAAAGLSFGAAATAQGQPAAGLVGPGCGSRRRRRSAHLGRRSWRR